MVDLAQQTGLRRGVPGDLNAVCAVFGHGGTNNAARRRIAGRNGRQVTVRQQACGIETRARAPPSEEENTQ
jgi:hypothetical protein